MTICYFSATGNCLFVTRKIGGKLLYIPHLMRQESIEIKDDALIRRGKGRRIPYMDRKNSGLFSHFQVGGTMIK